VIYFAHVWTQCNTKFLGKTEEVKKDCGRKIALEGL
jgi:hypothetical protein